MDSEQDRELQVIREQTHQTRAQLAEKLEALETKVSSTVSGVTDAVETVKDTVAGVSDVVANVTESVTDAVTSVTDSVTGTVETVQAFDPSPHIQKAPWTSVGCAFATGFAAAYFMGSGKGNGHTAYTPPIETAVPTNGHAKESQQPTALGPVVDTLADLGGSVRSLGISALIGVVSHLAKSAVPEAMKQDVSTALDKLKSRLGGHHNVNPETFLKQ